MKKYLYLFITLIFFFIILFFNIEKIEKILPDFLKKIIPWKTVEYFYEFKNANKAIKNYNYFYNALFLPETHFRNLNLNKIDVYFDGKKIINKKIFLSLHSDDIYFTTNSGEIFKLEESDIIKNKKIEIKLLKSNLQRIFSFNFYILDTFIDNNTFYISIGFDDIKKDSKKICKNFSILRSNINSYFEFEKIFTNTKCAEHEIVGGRMQKILFEKKNYLIFSLSDIANDLDNSDPQLLDNFFGKINYINLENLESGIFSLGHRNPQGLSVNNNIILSTEHGPRGGDEINLIEKGKNYGWPVASYGKAYFTKDLTYKNSHNKYGYKEPVFSFLSAIGISELIKIPNSFFNNTDLENTYLISSLFGRSLFLTNFDEKFTKVTFIEKIYIGERIRDLIYLEKNKIVLLSLENPTRIGILK
jgi:hypothetical protein